LVLPAPLLWGRGEPCAEPIHPRNVTSTFKKLFAF
jgi:hypothetical protein